MKNFKPLKHWTLLVCLVVGAGVALWGGYASEPPSLPILTYTEQILRLPVMCPQLPEGLQCPLGEDRWVERMTWIDTDELVVVSALPDAGATSHLHFLLVRSNGEKRDLGKWHIGKFRTCFYKVIKVDSHIVCVFFDEQSPVAKGAIEVDVSNGNLHEVSLDDEVNRAVWWQDLGKSVGFETNGHIGPLTIYNGSGAKIAVGTLPPNLYLIEQYTPVLWRSTRHIYAAVISVPTRELAGWGEKPPSDISILQLPDTMGSQCKVIRQFTVSTQQEIPSPPAELCFEWRSLADPATDSVGTKISYRETIRFDSIQDERLCLRRLWIWDATSGSRTLVATTADYMSSDRSHSYTFNVDANGTVEESFKRFHGWIPLSELRSALSPNGKLIAYVKGSTLCIVEIP